MGADIGMRINAAIATGARYPWKLALLGLLLVIDMVTQATSDYGDFGTSSGAATFSFAFSLLTQFATAATIYSILSQTFPFQIGLVGVVTSRFLRKHDQNFSSFCGTDFSASIHATDTRLARYSFASTTLFN